MQYFSKPGSLCRGSNALQEFEDNGTGGYQWVLLRRSKAMNYIQKMLLRGAYPRAVAHQSRQMDR
jgi:hypothetical protein